MQILMLCIHTLMGFLDMPFSFWPFFFFLNLIFVDICRDWICYFCMIDTLISSNCSLSASSFAWQSCPSSSHDLFFMQYPLKCSRKMTHAESADLERSSLKPEEAVENSINTYVNICCPCGSSVPTESMIQVYHC